MTDELLDVINEKDQVIGREMRAVVHRAGLWHRGIHVFLFTPEGKLLVQTRGRHRQAFPLALDCSVSEHVKSGESYLQAARRGLREELSLSRIRLYPLVKFAMLYGPNDLEICTLYQGSVGTAQINFDPGEVEGIAYYQLEELDSLIQKGSLPISGWFVQLISWYLGRQHEMQLLRVYRPGNKYIPNQSAG